jgi:mannose-P-dolichol utilization defect protein 1
MLDQILGPDLAKLALDVLNYAMFLGGSLIKLPQIVSILRTMKVDGFSEASLTMEFVACVSFCAYNLLRGHPFKTWGEMAMITIQCGVQILLFWLLTKQRLPKLPRIMGGFFVILLVASFKQCPEDWHIGIGLIPTILGCIARVPQIVMNYQNKFTGNQSYITWGMAGCGNTARILTTILTINDSTQLLGHVVAWILNWSLVAQIVYYRKNTDKTLSKPTKTAVKEDDSSAAKVSTTSAQRRGTSQNRTPSPGASRTPSSREDDKDK